MIHSHDPHGERMRRQFQDNIRAYGSTSNNITSSHLISCYPEHPTVLSCCYIIISLYYIFFNLCIFYVENEVVHPSRKVYFTHPGPNIHEVYLIKLLYIYIDLTLSYTHLFVDPDTCTLTHTLCISTYNRERRVL